MSKILMVISAADTLTLADGTEHPTGYWAEEVAASHQVLRQAGVQVEIATPAGKQPTADPISLDERGGVAEADATKFQQYLDSIAADLAQPLALADVVANDYDAISPHSTASTQPADAGGPVTSGRWSRGLVRAAGGGWVSR